MNLNKYLPEYYQNSPEVIDIQNSLETEKNTLITSVDDLGNQLFVDTATWGLNLWEKYLNLPTNVDESYESRRSRIKTRLRGQGTLTKANIKNICKSFTNGEVEIIEDFDDYSFIIKFVDIKGIPSNIDYLTKSLKMVIPAHLSFSYQYLYNVWGFLATKSWNQLTTKTWKEIRTIE